MTYEQYIEILKKHRKELKELGYSNAFICDLLKYRRFPSIEFCLKVQALHNILGIISAKNLYLSRYEWEWRKHAEEHQHETR